MAPRRGGGRIRPAQNHAPALQSDYDTDAANMTDTATPAPVPLRTNEELNLLVLKRHYPSVEEIVTVANFAVVYIFSPTGQWEKCGIEGTMFVCQSAPEEIAGSSTPISRYDIIVINRKGLDNFSTEIRSGEGVELNGEYIIAQAEGDDGDKIYGLWIFSEPPPSSTADIRAVTAEKIIECGVRAEESRLVAEREAVTRDTTQSEAAERDSAQRQAQREAAEVVHRNALQQQLNAQQQQSQQNYGHAPSHPTVGRQVSMDELFGQEPRQPQQFHHQPLHQPHPQAQQQPQYHQQPDPAQFFHQQGNHAQFPGQQSNPMQHNPQQNGYPQFNPQQNNNNPQFNPQPHNPAHFNSQQYPGPPPQAFPPGYNPQLGGQQPQQRDVIGDLFRNAKHGYNG